jgi:hypothetical protein
VGSPIGGRGNGIYVAIVTRWHDSFAAEQIFLKIFPIIHLPTPLAPFPLDTWCSEKLSPEPFVESILAIH